MTKYISLFYSQVVKIIISYNDNDQAFNTEKLTK